MKEDNNIEVVLNKMKESIIANRETSKFVARAAINKILKENKELANKISKKVVDKNE